MHTRDRSLAFTECPETGPPPHADSDLSPKPGHSTTPQEEALQDHQGCKVQQASSPGVRAPHSSSAMPGVSLARSPDPPKPQSAPPRRLCHNVWIQTGVKWKSPQPSWPTVQVSKQPWTRVLAPGSRRPGHTGNQASKTTLFQTGDLNRTVLPVPWGHQARDVVPPRSAQDRSRTQDTSFPPQDDPLYRGSLP